MSAKSDSEGAGLRTDTLRRESEVAHNLDVLAAEESHLPEITEIYNDAVIRTTAIWNDVQVDVENRRAWLAEREALGCPVLVAVSDLGRVLGYAALGNFRPFDGYRFTVEDSVYVRSDGRRRGTGRALVTALMDRARALGKHRMIAAIEATNSASIRLHESLGFERCGTMSEVGFKFGRWLDLAWFSASLVTAQREEHVGAASDL
jgi:L-amino acid N-acyltransferase